MRELKMNLKNYLNFIKLIFGLNTFLIAQNTIKDTKTAKTTQSVAQYIGEYSIPVFVTPSPVNQSRKLILTLTYFTFLNILAY